MATETYTCCFCEEVITDGRILKALDKTWHTDCFKCVDCSTTITSGTFAVKNGGPLCDTCAGGDIVAPGEQKTCEKCSKALGAKFIHSPFGGYLHPECFTCAHCNKMIDGSAGFIKKDGKVYHGECAMGGKVCATCGKALEGKIIQAEGKAYHKDCFICFGCKTPLNGSYMLLHDNPHCTECYKKNKNAKPLVSPSPASNPASSSSPAPSSSSSSSNLPPSSSSSSSSYDASAAARADLKKVNVGGNAYKPVVAPSSNIPPVAAATENKTPAFCGECGTKTDGSARFCGECGFKFY